MSPQSFYRTVRLGGCRRIGALSIILLLMLALQTPLQAAHSTEAATTAQRLSPVADDAPQLLDIIPGGVSSNPSEFVALDNVLLFSADDGIHGFELWQSDGTAAGTTILKDIWPGKIGSAPYNLTRVGSSVFFSASTPDHDGRYLWRTDGTASGTTSVAFFLPEGSSSFVAAGGKLFFVALTGHFWFRSLWQLWMSDGTASGTQIVGIPDNLEYMPPFTDLTAVGDRLFLVYKDGLGGGGLQLWTCTPADGGATLLRGINARYLTAVHQTLFFVGYEGTPGSDLWKSDGTPDGTVRVVDPSLGDNPNRTSSLASGPDKLWFFAHSDPTDIALWTSDGSAAGTVQITVVSSDTARLSPTRLVTVGSTLFFYQQDYQANAPQLWSSKGAAASTLMLKDFSPGRGLTALGQPYYAVSNRMIYFSADDGLSGTEVWASDGTAAGTRQVGDIVPGIESSDPAELTIAGTKLFFSAATSEAGRELWVMNLGARSYLPLAQK
jgi:ELWxxDGT repeat protein